jgi:hypothetical protein
LSVALGRLHTVTLDQPTRAPDIKRFQLPQQYVATINNAPQSHLHRRGAGFTRNQLSVMARIATDGEMGIPGQLAMTDDPMINEIVGTGDTLTAQAEWLFHGSKASWDTIYQAGGLTPQGDNLSISDHVHSSSTNQTAYISTTRDLGVAACFASGGMDPAKGEFGYIYLVHVDNGIAIGPNHNHQQAEVSTLGEIPVREIFMFQWLGNLRTVYVNLEFRSLPITPALIREGKRLLGGR